MRGEAGGSRPPALGLSQESRGRLPPGAFGPAARRVGLAKPPQRWFFPFICQRVWLYQHRHLSFAKFQDAAVPDEFLFPMPPEQTEIQAFVMVFVLCIVKTLWMNVKRKRGTI